ncbi:hypothetical protein CBR_g3900 [Chara braunii]|uniref:Myb/SANT-like DNA-binding domain-containing protein n=1 Tax=Chara braunii TaxID=69332 RepID=A0A388KGN0_CHABU|nr:hypothetical protein CBR_g3900 [Chara braunii]|eukprot:GBG69201.1 hypothetical protein CBR_g3900 [Chara braunii]
MDGRQAVCRSAGGEGGGQGPEQSLSRGSRAVERSKYAHLPPHLQPLPDTSDEEEDGRRSRVVPLGSGSTQEWTATEICGSREPSYGQSYTQLLQQGLSGDEGDGGVNLTFGLCSGRSSSSTRTVLVDNSPDDDGGQVTVVARPSKFPASHLPCVVLPTPAVKVVQVLIVAADIRGDGDNIHDGRAEASLEADGALYCCVRGSLLFPDAKKSMGKGSDVEADGNAEGGCHFWSVDDMVALIRAKRDQDAHVPGMGTAYGRMKPREWKWLDVEQRLKKVGVEREAERCGKKWDNLMQQFKKVHHFQGLSGKQDFFQFTGKERLSKGFSFNMDRAVYDEILGSTAKSHTINPKNVADTGAPGGVRLPSANSSDPESVGDRDAAAGLDDDDDGSTRGSSQPTGCPAGFGKRKSTRQQTFDALSECMEKHGALVASTMESNSKRQCSIQIQQCEALEAEVEVQKKYYAASDEVSKLMCHALLEIAKAIREHAEDWVAEGDDSHGESDFAESEEIPMKRKSSRRQIGALRIDDVAERRSAGGRGASQQDANVAARPVTGRAGGSVATQQNRAPLPRVNEPPAAQEVFVRGRTPSTPRQTTATEVGVAAQGIAQGIANRSPAHDNRGESTVVAARAAEVPKAGAATAGGASQAGEGGRSGGAANVGASHAVEGARAGGGNAGEGRRAGAVARVGEDDEALENRVWQRSACEGIDVASKLCVDDIHFWNETEGNTIVRLMQEARLYLVAVARGVQPPAIRRSIVLPHTTIPQHKIDDESEFSAAQYRALKVQTIALRVIHGHKDDELAAYQEASVQRLVGAFTSAVSTAEGVDGRRVSHERLKIVAKAMWVMLATTMWLMRMGGDDRRAHYDAWVFVQLTVKPTLIASMHRSFDARHHIVQAATAITDKLAKPPITLLAPPVYIPDWASIGVKFSHDATLSSPMEAQKLDWLGTGPPEDDDDAAVNDHMSAGGS